MVNDDGIWPPPLPQTMHHSSNDSTTQSKPADIINNAPTLDLELGLVWKAHKATKLFADDDFDCVFLR